MTLSGDGTITGLVAGGLPDATITTDELAAGAALNNAPNSVGFRNRIINGDMRIDQRNAGASVTPSNVYTLDRWVINPSTEYLGVATVQQNLNSLTPPDGFTNYIGLVVDTGTSPLTNPFYNIRQIIEGFNVADLGWGTSSAKSITLSFWVRASITGTYTAAVRNSASNRSYVATYTISSANTWEHKTVTISGDTSGTWLTNNSTGITLSFGLSNNTGTFSTSSPNQWNASNNTGATTAVEILSTTGATFYLTGVQLEVGSVATPFERRPFGAELALCQRYYYRLTPGSGNRFGLGQATGSGAAGIFIPFMVSMRTAPSALEQSGTATDYRLLDSTGSGIAGSAVPVFNTASTDSSLVTFFVSTGVTAGNASVGFTAGAGYLGFSAEL
jgi:hypothetical protein